MRARQFQREEETAAAPVVRGVAVEMPEVIPNLVPACRRSLRTAVVAVTATRANLIPERLHGSVRMTVLLMQPAGVGEVSLVFPSPVAAPALLNRNKALAFLLLCLLLLFCPSPRLRHGPLRLCPWTITERPPPTVEDGTKARTRRSGCPPAAWPRCAPLASPAA